MYICQSVNFSTRLRWQYILPSMSHGKMTLYKLVVLGDGGVGKTAIDYTSSSLLLLRSTLNILMACSSA